MDRPPPHDYPLTHHHPHPQQPPHFGFPSQFPPFPYQQYPRPLPPHPLLFPPPPPHPPLFHHPPPFAPPPPDPDLHKRIDKLVEYAAKNGPEFESMIREKQQDNPAYAFLFGAEGAAYYRYKLWVSTRPPVDPMGSPFGHVSPITSSTQPRVMNLHPGYHHIHHQLPQHPVPQPYLPFKGLAGPLPVDVVAELNGVLGGLTGTKESIKGAKVWFMQRAPFAPALAEAFKERVFLTDDSEKQLHVVFLANDILFDSLQRRANPSDLDNEALAFKPVLGPMLARIYHNPHNKDANQSRLEKILQFWASKEVYDLETIRHLESVMTGGVPPPTHYGAPDAAFPMDPSGLQQNVATHALRPRQPGELELTEMSPTSVPSSHFIPPAAPPSGPYPTPANPVLFPGSLPIQSSMQAVAQSPVPNLLPPSAGVSEQVRPPPYPLFPPGLIPGMVRKMQIGSGVPYSPLSSLDIPTVIPPSTIPQSEILERVSKFFKEIGEANPSEGPMKSSNSVGDRDDYEHDEYEREKSVRKGGACIPPPASLNVDPETGTFPDGSVDRKHGSSGRLGLGATADPNEVSQYDDVYSSYRKKRSSTYHSSMSVRSTTR